MRKLISALVITLGLVGCELIPLPHYNPKLILSTESLDEYQKSGFIKAVLGWNKKLGFDYFVIDPHSFRITFWVQTQEKPLNHPSLLGVVSPRRIIIKRGLDQGILVKVSYHELGHALGLPHTNNLYSIMYPHTGLDSIDEPTETDVVWAKSLISLTDFDREYRIRGSI